MTTQIREPFGEPVGESATAPLSGVSSPSPRSSDGASGAHLRGPERNSVALTHGSNTGYEWPASAEARLLEALMQLEGEQSW